jgi:hypothetical protein
MTTNTDVSKAATHTATTLEWPAALYTLRARYGESRDLFSPREMAHLRFLRWLIQSGRLAP